MDLSVIIPIYKVEEYLESCLESVRKGIGSLEAEVILVDDGSPDGSTAIAMRYAEAHPQFRYFRKENGGLSSARNYGVAQATGKYICFADSDDLVEKGIYQLMFEAAEANGSDMAVCAVAKYTDEKPVRSPLHERAFHGIPEGVTHITRSPQLASDSTAWNKLIRRDFYLEHGFTWPEGYLFEDIPVTLPMHYYANQVSVVRETGYFWRVREGNSKSITQQFTTRKNLTDKIEMLERLMSFLDGTVKDPEIRFQVENKALTGDFIGYLNRLDLMSEEQAADYVELIAGFIERNISPGTLGKIRLIYRQIAEDVLARDMDHLRRSVNYNKTNYRNAPVVRTDSGFEFLLPDEIFRFPERDARYDFRDFPPETLVTALRKDGDRILLEGVLYYRRISVPSVSDMTLSAYLLNERTGAKTELKLEQFPAPEFSDEQEEEISTDDYRAYRYDYTGAGFRLWIEPDRLGLPEMEGKNKIMLRYDLPLGSGVRMLRGVSRPLRKPVRGAAVRGEKTTASFSIDARGTLSVIAEKKKDLVSVIVPVYNAEKTLRRCLDSICGQTYRDLEILLVNDASPDGSLAICREYEAIDPRIRVFDCEHAGVSATRNYALDRMSGVYFAFVDSDDLASPNYVERLHELAVQKDAAVVTCLARDEKNTSRQTYNAGKKQKPRKITLEKYNFIRRWSHRVAWGGLYRTADVGDIRFCSDLSVTEDTLFAAEVLKKVGSVIHTDEELYCYMIYPDSACHGKMSRKKYDDILSWERIAAMFRSGPKLPYASAKARLVMHSIEGLKDLALQKDPDPELYRDLMRHVRFRTADVLGVKMQKKTLLRCIAYTLAPEMMLKRHVGNQKKK